MPNDPNQSGRGAPNKLGGSSWLERQGQAYAQQTAQERLERQRIGLAQERIESYRAALNTSIPEQFIPELQEGIQHETKMVNTLMPRASLRAETRRERYTSLAVGHINREFSSSSVNGQVNDFSRSSAGQTAAMGYIGSSYRNLEQQQSSVMNEISGLGRGSASLAERLYNSDGTQNAKVAWRIADKDRQRQELEKNLGGIHGAMMIQRSMGLDPISQNRDLFGAGQRAAAVLGTNKLQADIASGTGLGGMSLKDLKEREAKAAEGLIDALEKLKNTVGKSDEQIGQLKDNAEKLKLEFEETNGVIAAGGGSGRGNRMAAGLGMAAGAMDLAAGFGREVLLNQTNAITGNRITAASLTNNLFDRRRAALAGDMTQLTALSGGTMSGAQAEGEVNRKSSTFTETAATGVALAGGGTAIAVGLANAGGLAALLGGGAAALLSTPALAVGAGIGAVGYGIYRGIGAFRGAPQQQEKLAEEQRQIQLADQLAHIPGAMRQRLYDYGQGLRGASMEAGGAGDVFLASAGSSSMLDRLQNARISTEQFGQLSAQGFGQQGSVFNSDRVFGARNLERSGFGSMGTNMSRMGTLAAAGSNNPQAGLQSVMEAAFTKSLDSSKAISMMVDNTATMAGSSYGAARGMDTTQASSRILSSLVNPEMQNKEMAISRAMTASQIFNDVNSGTSTSFSDMMGTMAISKAGGVSRTQGMILKGMDNFTAEQLKLDMSRIEKLAPGDKERAKFAEKVRWQMNLPEFINKKTNEVDYSRLGSAIDTRSGSIFREGEFQTIVDQKLPGYQDFKTGKITAEQLQTMYPETADKVSLAGGIKRISVNEIGSRGAAGSISAEGASKADGAFSGAASGIKATLDDLATVQFAEMSKEAKLAADQLGGVTQALKAMNEASKSLADKVNDGNAESVMGASAEAAKNFEMGAKTFSTEVNNFGKILKQFAINVGVRVPESSEKK